VQHAQQFLQTQFKIDGILTLLADGNFVPQSGAAEEYAIVKGDQKSLTIALASVIAKEYRDHLMRKLDAQYPQYGWAKNAGYPTKAHRQALQEFGPSPLHRQSFQGVRECHLP
jgi:ribonuclease HII